jgi:hypothetical protein
VTASIFLIWLVCSHVYFVNIIYFCVIPKYLNFAVIWKDLLPVFALQFCFTHIYVYTCDSNLPDHKYLNQKHASKCLCYVKQTSFAWQYFSDKQKPRWKHRFLYVLHHDFFEGLTSHWNSKLLSVTESSCRSLKSLSESLSVGKIDVLRNSRPAYAGCHRNTNEGRANKKL